eukprot:6290-Heterococcus_DN1.PRE.10
MSSQQTVIHSMLAQPHSSILLLSNTALLHSVALLRSDTSALPCVAACLLHGALYLAEFKIAAIVCWHGNSHITATTTALTAATGL